MNDQADQVLARAWALLDVVQMTGSPVTVTYRVTTRRSGTGSSPTSCLPRAHHRRGEAGTFSWTGTQGCQSASALVSLRAK